MQLRVHRLPSLVEPSELAGSVVVVVDLLRASTTICQALAADAEFVLPFVEVHQTLEAADRLGRDRVTLGGERFGKLIGGFDLGNSPCEYTAESVGRRRVLFTTTNGAKALHHAREAKRILVGSIVNRAAVAAAVADEPRVEVLCAGTRGEETLDDVLGAGAIVQAIIDRSSPGGAVDALLSLHLDETAMHALKAWSRVTTAAEKAGRPIADELAVALRDTPGGRDLIQIGLDRDLADCAKLDSLAVVPEYRPTTGEIRPA